MKRPIFLVLFALSLLGFTCGNRKPVVVNALDRSIYVRSTWEDGTSVGGELAASGHLFLSDPPHYPKEVMISVPGGDSHTFTKANAPDLIGHPVTGAIIGWKVTDSGVLPLFIEELK